MKHSPRIIISTFEYRKFVSNQMQRSNHQTHLLWKRSYRRKINSKPELLTAGSIALLPWALNFGIIPQGTSHACSNEHVIFWVMTVTFILGVRFEPPCRVIKSVVSARYISKWSFGSIPPALVISSL